MYTTRGEKIRSGVLTLAAGATLFGLFGPWLRSGASSRSSFELLDLTQRLGFASGGIFEWAVRAWPFVPLALVGTVVAAWSSRTGLAAALGAGSACYVMTVAIAVTNAPDIDLIGIEWGVGVSVTAGLALLGAACWTGLAARSA